LCTFCKISALADVEPGLVRASVQNLLYHRVVGLASIFQYSNVYTVTPALAALRTDSQLQRDLLATAARQEGCLSDFRDVYNFIASFTYGTTVRDLCGKFPTSVVGVDERRLVQHLVLKGVLRRVHKFPVWTGEGPGPEPRLYQWFSGQHNCDHISVATGLSTTQLDKILEEDSSIVVIHK